jgi:NADH dehydrogenase FAD-containing subunit
VAVINYLYPHTDVLSNSELLGAVGIEMAAELKLVEPSQNVTLIQSRDKLLSSEPLPDDFKDRTALVLQEQGVKVILGHRVTKQEEVDLKDGNPHFKLTMSDGSEILAGHVIWAISKSIPSTTFLPEETLNSEGYVKINSKCATSQPCYISNTPD